MAQNRPLVDSLFGTVYIEIWLGKYGLLASGYSLCCPQHLIVLMRHSFASTGTKAYRLREPYRAMAQPPGKDKMSTDVPNSAILNDGYLHAVVDKHACFTRFHATRYSQQHSCSLPRAANPLSGQNVEEQLVRCRYVVTAKQAQAWYNDCLTGEVQLRKGDEERYRPLHKKLFPEPSWPHLVTTTDALRRLARRTIGLALCVK